MSGSGSVSHWLEQLKSGDDEAATRLWNRYLQQLLSLACRRLRGAPGAADEEDIAACALETFFLRAQQGFFPDVRDRHQLWHLLITITERKAISELRRQKRQKRGSGEVVSESDLHGAGQSMRGAPLDELASPEPSPEFAAQMTEAFHALLDKLDKDLQQIALLKLAAYTNEEIATQIQRSLPTVERRLKLIREIWRQELAA